MDTDNAPTLSPPLPSTRALPAQQQPDGTSPQFMVLEAEGRSQALACPAGSVVQVLRGRIWLTCEGLAEDHFLSAGQFKWQATAARLHISAEGREPATLQLMLP